MITGIHASLIRYSIRFNFLVLALIEYRSAGKVLKLIKEQKNIRKRSSGNDIKKFVRNGNQFLFSPDLPTWPSAAFNKFIKNEFKRQMFDEIEKSPLLTVILSITSNCPLSCEHCYESKYVNTSKQMSLDKLIGIVSELEKDGIRHIQLSGGEPLSRFDELIKLLNASSKDINFWLLTSGYGLSIEKAKALKDAGLRGMHISLDSHNEEEHNRFRANPKSYQQVMSAIELCHKVGIVTSLSLTATKKFVNEENISGYLALAKEKKISFVRILEARAVGRYENKDIALSKEQLGILEKAFLRCIGDSTYKNYPIVELPAYQQKSVGCLGAGNRYLYIDSVGNYHACPFCQGNTGNVSELSIGEARKILQKNKCHKFKLAHL